MLNVCVCRQHTSVSLFTKTTNQKKSREYSEIKYFQVTTVQYMDKYKEIRFYNFLLSARTQAKYLLGKTDLYATLGVMCLLIRQSCQHCLICFSPNFMCNTCPLKNYSMDEYR